MFRLFPLKHLLFAVMLMGILAVGAWTNGVSALAQSTSDKINILDDYAGVVYHPKISATLLQKNDLEGLLAQRVVELNKTSKEATILLAGEYSTDVPSYGFSRDVALVQLNLQSAKTNKDKRYYVYIDYPLLDSIQLKAYADGQWQENYHTGDVMPVSTRPVDHRVFAFPISLSPGSSKTIFLIAESTDTLQIPVYLIPESVFPSYMHRDNYVFGLFYGGLFMMATLRSG